jgi:hypothetical protein
VRGSRRVNDIAEELASKTRMLIEEQEKTCQLEERLSRTMRLLEEERRVASQMRLQAAGELRNHNGSPMGVSMLSPRQQSERRGPLFSPRGGVIMNPDMRTEDLQLSPIKDSMASPRSGVLEFSPGQVGTKTLSCHNANRQSPIFISKRRRLRGKIYSIAQPVTHHPLPEGTSDLPRQNVSRARQKWIMSNVGARACQSGESLRTFLT